MKQKTFNTLGFGPWDAYYDRGTPAPGWRPLEPLYPAPSWAQYTVRGLPGWKPGHALQGPKLAQSAAPFGTVLMLAVDGVTTLAAGYMTTKTRGMMNAVSWIVAVVAAVRTFGDVGEFFRREDTTP